MYPERKLSIVFHLCLRKKKFNTKRFKQLLQFRTVSGTFQLLVVEGLPIAWIYLLDERIRSRFSSTSEQNSVHDLPYEPLPSVKQTEASTSLPYNDEIITKVSHSKSKTFVICFPGRIRIKLFLYFYRKKLILIRRQFPAQIQHIRQTRRQSPTRKLRI